MSQVTDPNLQNILNQILSFGFSFYGYDEEGKPLVTAPNGQVIEVNIAIEFVNQQIRKQKQQSSQGVENPENIENLDQNVSVESSIETTVETKLENPEESKDSDSNQQSYSNQNKDLEVKQKAPQLKLSTPEIKPYGEGFDPKSFDPGNINQVEKFVEENSKKSKSSSNAWLAKQFKMFLEEMKNQK